MDHEAADHERADHDASDREREAPPQREREHHGEEREEDPGFRGLLERGVLPKQLEGRVHGHQRRRGKHSGKRRVRRRRVASERRHQSPDAQFSWFDRIRERRAFPLPRSRSSSAEGRRSTPP